jgi:hypothetical protein
MQDSSFFLTFEILLRVLVDFPCLQDSCFFLTFEILLRILVDFPCYAGFVFLSHIRDST